MKSFIFVIQPPSIIRQFTSRRIKWAGHVVRMGKETEVYRVFVEKPKGRRPLGRPKRRREDWIRIDLRETGWGVRIQLAQDSDRWRAVLNTAMNLRALTPRS
jgi:hypothetical protein